MPSHVQVSASCVLPSEPPNITISPRTGSYVSAWPYLAGGLVVAHFCVQLKPSHSQVSDEGTPETLPPYSTTTCRALSYAIAWSDSTGGRIAGSRCCQPSCAPTGEVARSTAITGAGHVINLVTARSFFREGRCKCLSPFTT